MRGRRYNTERELIEATERSINDINRQHSLIGIKNLPARWRKIIDKQGEYYK